jgi:hypothetical protein
MGRNKRYRDAGVLGVYCVLTLVLTWPLVPQVTTRLAGDDVDVLINPWADWWTRKAITEYLDLYHTDYLFYPQGTSLVFHSFSHVNTAISLLLAPLIGTFAAYNLPILLAYVLSGFGVYLLVRHLTDCDFAGFVAGVVFAFSPYHMFESSHPVLVTTQFMPLFALSLVRVLYDDGDDHRARIGQVLLAALWFVLTALSSWHLMLMLAGWTFLYLVYGWLSERDNWTPGASRYLILLACLVTLVVLPFVWPILREQLTVETTYMTVPVEEGRGNDVLSFFIPNRLHPILGPLFLEVNSRIGYTRNWPAYLGYVALALAAAGVATARLETRFWWVTASIFLVLSLGAQVKWEGVPIHSFYLPWAIPIISVLRHPLRLNTLLFFSLAVLVGFGGRWLWERLLSRNRMLMCLALVSMTGLLLFEYRVYPFPTTQPSYSPFLHQLAEEDGDFAVADFPMDRQAAKYYMYYQTIHGKKIVGGVVSRTPFDADAFVDANPLLSAIRNENVPPQYLEERLAVLAALDVRYIIIHKRFLNSERMEHWQRWLVSFPPPFYEDESVIVYRTVPSPKTRVLQDEGIHRLDAQLGDHIYLRGYQLNARNVSAGHTLTVTLFWQSDSRLAEDYHVFVHLLDTEGRLLVQQDGVPVYGERPTWSWWDGEVIRDEYVLILDRNLPAGDHTPSIGMYDPVTGVRLPAVSPAGERLSGDSIPLQDIEVTSP